MALNFLSNAFLIGTGATLAVDLWALVRTRLFGIPAPDYGLVGRWIGYLPRGVFRHRTIAAAPALRRERLAGWIAHYLIGVAFAAALLGIVDVDWVRHPTLAPALIFGVATVAAPFFVMQPGMGAGIAASRTPRPAAARLQSVITHAVFGIGLYLAALVVSWLV